MTATSLLLGILLACAHAADPPAEAPLAAGEAGTDVPTRKLFGKERAGSVSSLRLGAGLLYDFVTYAQDEASRRQVDLAPEAKLRDFRFLLKGRFNTERPLTWTMGVMYDAPSSSWLFRETGLMLAVPEIYSHFFVGRTKEGFSLNKVMVGYAGWTMERATISDAAIPILADGVKWLGYVPELRLLWNVGVYGDALSEGQAFSSYDNQVVLRLAALSLLPESRPELLHIGVNARYGTVNNGQLQLRSRPEVFPAPYFVDTGKFPAHHTRMLGWEAYFRKGSWLVGSEYWFEAVASPEKGNPLVHGGDIVGTWLVTGETRGYNSVGGYFKQVVPARSVFEGGHGAWELVLRQSYIDLDSGGVAGGKFWRLTPMVNWYLSDRYRLEAAYGYGVLESDGLRGGTHFFQFRAQAWL